MVVGHCVGDDAVEGACVGEFEAAAQSVGQKLAGEGADELLPFRPGEHGGKLEHAVEFLSGGEFAARIDGRFAILVPPGADAIEIFKGAAVLPQPAAGGDQGGLAHAG